MKKKAVTSLSKKSKLPVTGPARSRRFGLSINVNFGTPGHSCGWSCVYCPWREPAPGTRKAKPVRKPPAADLIIAELKKRLQAYPKVETVILGGNTEPTTHPDFEEIAAQTLSLRKSLRAHWRIICLTNGTALDQPKIRKVCNRLDEAWVKLDCADDVLFQKTNKPGASATKSIQSYARPLKDLDQIRIQTTLWRYPGKTGFQNWSADNLSGLLDIYKKIKPDALHLVTVKRRPGFKGVQPVTYDEMEAFALRVEEIGVPVEVFH